MKIKINTVLRRGERGTEGGGWGEVYLSLFILTCNKLIPVTIYSGMAMRTDSVPEDLMWCSRKCVKYSGGSRESRADDETRNMFRNNTGYDV